MELHFSTKRYRKRKQYDKLDAGRSNGRYSKVIKLGIRLRRLRPIMKLKLKLPLRLWKSLKNGYINMMLRFAESVGDLNSGNRFSVKCVRGDGEVKLKYTTEELEKRIVYEIYKSLVISSQLGSAYA